MRILENGALSLLNAAYEAMDGDTVCDPDTPLVEIEAAPDTDREVEDQHLFTVDTPASGDALPCGLTNPALGEDNTYQLSFRTRSLPGAFSSKDKKYILTCNFDDNTVSLTSAGVEIFSELDEDVIEATLPMFSLEILKYSQSYPNGRRVYQGGSITINDRLKIRITLDMTSVISEWTYVYQGGSISINDRLKIRITLDMTSGFNGFRVKECTFSNTEDASMDVIGGGVDDANVYCSSAAGLFLGLPRKAFEYDGEVRYRTATTEEFESFTFELVAGQTTSSLTCEVEYCNDDGAVPGECLAEADCEDVVDTEERKKRSTESEEPKTTQLVTFFTFGKPTHQELNALEIGENIEPVICEEQTTTGYLIGLIVLAVALVLTMAMVLFMFFRRGEKQMTHA